MKSIMHMRRGSRTTLFVIIAALTAFVAAQYYIYPTREYMRPLVGGLQVQANSFGYCTLSYIVTKDNIYGAVFPAHCINFTKACFVVYQPNNTRSEYRIGVTDLSDDRADAAFIRLDSGVGFWPAVINITGPRSYQLVDTVGDEDFQSATPGTPVCKTGRTTGTTCGKVVRQYSTVIIGGKTIYYVVETDASGFFGDSGSPFYSRYFTRTREGLPATFIYGHLSGVSNCGQGLCSRTYFVSTTATRQYLGVKICTVYGCS